MRRGALAAIVATLGSALALPAGAADVPLRPGFWSLAQLGAPGLALAPGRGYQAERTITYRLPAGAFEGDGHWFVIRLDFEVRFRQVPKAARQAVAGTTTEVAVDADGDTIASILFTPVLRGGRLLIRRSGFGLLAGKQRTLTPSLDQRVRFRNFFTYHGVRGGANTLVFRVGTPVGGLVRDVRFRPDTGILIQRQGPIAYRLVLADSSGEMEPGDRMTITAMAQRTGGTAPDAATFTITYPKDGLRLEGPPRRKVAWQGPRPRATFSLVGEHAGSWPVLVRADAGGTRQAASTVVHVRVAASTTRWWLVGVAAGLAALATAAAVVVTRRVRRA